MLINVLFEKYIVVASAVIWKFNILDHLCILKLIYIMFFAPPPLPNKRSSCSSWLVWQSQILNVFVFEKKVSYFTCCFARANVKAYTHIYMMSVNALYIIRSQFSLTMTLSTIYFNCVLVGSSIKFIFLIFIFSITYYIWLQLFVVNQFFS